MTDRLPSPARRRARSALAALLPVTLVATTGLVLAAFTATTTNPGNAIATGTVAISDNDGANVPMYTAATDGGIAPGQTVTKCLTTTYTGTLDADVRLYTSTPITDGDQFTLTIDRDETPAGAPFPSCTGFAPTSTALPTDDLADAGLATNYATGLPARSTELTTTGQQVAYRFTITAKDDPTVNTHTAPRTTSDHTWTFEARNSEMSTNPVGATATSGNGSASLAFDGNLSTKWVSSNRPEPSAPQVLTNVYATPRDVSSVEVRGDGPPGNYYGPSNYRIEGLVNGTWQPLAVVRDTTLAPRTTSVPRTSITGIRLVVTTAWHASLLTGPGNVQVVEVIASG